jgi:hypothetical protein
LPAQRNANGWSYAKRPFAGPQQVLDYVGRYTHRVALSNNRLIDIDNGRVQFHWKDYRDNSKIKVMDLDADEFIRRFLLLVLYRKAFSAFATMAAWQTVTGGRS